METIAAFVSAAAVAIFAFHVRKSHRPQRGAISQTSARLFAVGRRAVIASLLDNVGAIFGADVGGSLTKLMVFIPDRDIISRVLRKAPLENLPSYAAKLASLDQIAAFLMSTEKYGRTGVRDARLAFHMDELGGTFHFVRYETRRMEGALRLAHKHGLNAGMHSICATGGGAHKFAASARSQLGVTLDARDEIDCLVKGMAFLLAHVHNKAYTFDGQDLIHVDTSGRGPASGSTTCNDSSRSGGVQYPYLLVNVGSGVGFILVTREGQWQRVSGTSLGGGTYYGLCNMLTGVSEFDEMLDLAELGNNSNVDLTVGDIYGGDYSKFGLKATTIAASFGKAVSLPPPQESAARSRQGSTVNSVAQQQSASKGSRGRSTRSNSSSAAAYSSTGTGTGAAACDNGVDGSFRSIGGPAPKRSVAQSASSPSPAAAPASAPATIDDGPTSSPHRPSHRVTSPERAIRFPESPVRIPPGLASLSAPAAAFSPLESPSSPTSLSSFHTMPDGPLRGPAEQALPPDSTAPGTPSHADLKQRHQQQQQHANGGSASSGSWAGSTAVAAQLQQHIDNLDPSAVSKQRRASTSSSASANGSSAAAAQVPHGAPPMSPSLTGNAPPGSSTHGRYQAKDIARSLLIMISNNIGQLAYLNACKHKCKDIYFAGNFLRHENTIAMRTLAYAIRFWSKGSMAGLFLRHEGYCGALGAFLSTLETEIDLSHLGDDAPQGQDGVADRDGAASGPAVRASAS